LSSVCFIEFQIYDKLDIQPISKIGCSKQSSPTLKMQLSLVRCNM